MGTQSNRVVNHGYANLQPTWDNLKYQPIIAPGRLGGGDLIEGDFKAKITETTNLDFHKKSLLASIEMRCDKKWGPLIEPKIQLKSFIRRGRVS